MSERPPPAIEALNGGDRALSPTVTSVMVTSCRLSILPIDVERTSD